MLAAAEPASVPVNVGVVCAEARVDAARGSGAFVATVKEAQTTAPTATTARRRACGIGKPFVNIPTIVSPN
jgi:hypothetical protein